MSGTDKLRYAVGCIWGTLIYAFAGGVILPVVLAATYVFIAAPSNATFDSIRDAWLSVLGPPMASLVAVLYIRGVYKELRASAARLQDQEYRAALERAGVLRRKRV